MVSAVFRLLHDETLAAYSYLELGRVVNEHIMFVLRPRGVMIPSF